MYIEYDGIEYEVKVTDRIFKGEPYLQERGLACPVCPSSDAFTVYANEKEGDSLHGHCYSCKVFVELIDSEEESGVSKITKKKEGLSPEDLEHHKNKVKDIVGLSSNTPFKERGLTAETNQKYGIRTGPEGNRYYAGTKGSKLIFQKVRYPGKSFSFWYRDGKVEVSKADLFGQCRFPSGGKYLIIVGGEEDAPAYYQAFTDYYKSRGKDNYTMPVISPMTGEGSAHTQIKNNFEYVNSFDNIYICMDNDSAGREATEKIKKIIPEYKTYVIKLELNDPSDYIKNHRGSELVSAFWNAENSSGIGFVKPESIYELMLGESTKEKISFPTFAKGLQRKCAGGFTLGGYGVLIAPTGVGKTTITAAFVDHFIRNTPYNVCVISGEMTPGEYSTSLFSGVLGCRIENIETKEEREDYLKQPDIEKTIKDYLSSYGDKFVILKNGEESFNSERLKSACEAAVKMHNARVIILDPVQFLIGTDTEEVQTFVRWLKAFTMSNEVYVWVVSHIRKSVAGSQSNSTGKDLGEDDAKGVGALIENSSNNIIITRDKESEDEDERNTLKVKITKLRFGGTTGPAPSWRYLPEQHRFMEI